MMTRKHYKAIASIIKDSTIPLYDVNNDTKDTLDIRYMLVELCIMFKQDNKLFNSDKFINACKK